MRTQRIVIGTLFAALLGAIVWAGLSTLSKNRARAAYTAAYKRWVTSVETSPQWKARASAFNLHKKTAAAIFAGATRVQVFRVAPRNDTEKPKGLLAEIKTFGSGPLPFYAQEPDQTPVFATRLGAIILDPRNYPFPGQDTKQCLMEPGVDFRVWKDATFVDVLICFHCNQMAVLEYTPSVPMTDIGGLMEARSYVGGDIDAVRPQLLALAKSAMPEDRFMQGLE